VTLGARIRELRLKRGLTLEALGEKVSKDKGDISAYENGHHVPGIEALARIASVLGVTLDELVPPPQTVA
jgi:transcriptional regulator with XRE-family HTH domain